MDWPELLSRVRAETFVKHVESHDEIGSTNDRALVLAGDAECPVPALVIAKRQTAGRGRAANVWRSGPGSLTFSLIVNRPALPIEQTPIVSLLAGLGVRKGVSSVVAGHSVKVKWPNDVYVDGRKACGILTEIANLAPGRVVIGIGVNANNSLAEAPQEIRSKAVSLREATEQAIDSIELLVAMLIAIEEEFSLAEASGGFDVARWSPHCLLQGRTVRLRTPREEIAGLCVGVSDHGELLVGSEAHIHACSAGEIVSFSKSS